MQDKKNEKKNQFLCKMQEVTNGLWKLRKYTYNTYSNGQRLHNCFKSEPVAAESIFRKTVYLFIVVNVIQSLSMTVSAYLRLQRHKVFQQ